jgi:hypothetical protein
MEPVTSIWTIKNFAIGGAIVLAVIGGGYLLVKGWNKVFSKKEEAAAPSKKASGKE